MAPLWSLCWLARLSSRRVVSSLFNRPFVNLPKLTRTFLITNPVFCEPATTSENNFEFHKSYENLYAYKVLDGQPEYIKLKFCPNQRLLEGKDESLNPNVQKFIQLSKEEDVQPLHEPRYEEITTKLIEVIESLDDTNLLLILLAMRNFPFSNGTQAPNFGPLWQKVDEECLNRAQKKWTLEEIFVADDAWVLMQLTRLTKFHWHMLKKCARKCDKLSREQYMRYLFLLNRMRKIEKLFIAYELEHNLIRWIDKLSVDELAVAAMSFFKTNTCIQNDNLISTMLTAATKSPETVNDMAVSAITKLSRLHRHYEAGESIYNIQEAFTPYLDRLSLPALLHLALAGSNINVINYNYMTKLLDVLESRVPEARLKELERFALALGMFNVSCPRVINKILDELKKPERREELDKYGRSLPALIHYITYHGIFPQDLISTVLDLEYLHKYYGKGRHLGEFQREILCLDLTAEIEMPEYTGNRLNERTREYLLKCTTFYLTELGKGRRTRTETDMAEVQKVMEEYFDAKDKLYVGNLLPQFRTFELLMCVDKNWNAVKVPDYITSCTVHHPKLIPKSDLDGSIMFHAVVIISRNNHILRTREPTGATRLRERQLRKMGYIVHRIYAEEWSPLMFEADRNVVIRKVAKEFCQEIRRNAEGKNLKQKVVIR